MIPEKEDDDNISSDDLDESDDDEDGDSDSNNSSDNDSDNSIDPEVAREKFAALKEQHHKTVAAIDKHGREIKKQRSN